MSALVPAEPIGRHGRYSAAISTTFDKDDALQKSTSETQDMPSSTVPQPVHRRRSIDSTPQQPTSTVPPMAPHPPRTTAPSSARRRTANTNGNGFDFGLNSLGIPTGASRPRYNSMPTKLAADDGAVPSPAVRPHSSAPEMRRQTTARGAAADGSLPSLTSNFSRSTCGAAPSSMYGGSLSGMPPPPQPANTSLYGLQRQPTNLGSADSNRMNGMQGSALNSFQAQPTSSYGSFMAPGGTTMSASNRPISAGYVSSASSTTGSSTLHRDMSFLGLDSIASDSFRGDASLSQYPPLTSSYGISATGQHPSFFNGAAGGSFMQPVGGGSMMMFPGGSAGHGTFLGRNPYMSTYGTSQPSFNRFPSQNGSSVAQSRASTSQRSALLEQSLASMSLMGAGAFHPELASFQGSQRSGRMNITSVSSMSLDKERAASEASITTTGSTSTGVTRWVKPQPATAARPNHQATSGSKQEIHSAAMEFSIGSVVKHLGLEFIGTASPCVGVSALTILEHTSAAPSSRARVHSSDGRAVSITQRGTECTCLTEECLWRPRGSTSVSSELVADAARQFVEEGENTFIWVIAPAAKTSGDTHAHSVDLASVLCQKAVTAALHHEAGSHTGGKSGDVTELVASVITYHPPAKSADKGSDSAAKAQFTDLLAAAAPTRRQNLEVATSPITGSCVNGCVGSTIGSVAEFNDVVAVVRAHSDHRQATEDDECVVLWQLNLLRRTGDDVVLSSFTVASTSSPALVESVLDQNGDSQWALFKYGLGLGPCTLLAVLCVEESDQEAASTFSALERLRYRTHLGPRNGSVKGYIEEAESRIAELDALDDMLLMDTVGGAAGSVHHNTNTVHVRDKLHQHQKDFQRFLRKPSLSTAPLYVVSPTGTQKSTKLCLEDGDTTSKLTAAPPFYSAYVRRLDDTLAPRAAVSTLVEALNRNVVVVRQPDQLSLPFGGFEEAQTVSETTSEDCEYAAALAQSAAVANLEGLFLKGFNTSVVGVSPIPVASENSTANRTGGSAPGEERSMSGISATVGLAVRSVFDKIAKKEMGTVLRCQVSMYHVRDTEVADLLDDQDTPRFIPLTLVISPLLGTAPNLITQRTVTSSREYDTIVRQGTRQLRLVSRDTKDTDMDYLSYTVITVELKQTRKNYPDDVYVSSMTGVSLGENYNVLGDPSFFYDKSPACAPCVSLLKSCVVQCARSHCVAFLDEATTLEVATLLGRVRDMKRMETRPVIVGSTKRLIQRLNKLRSRLQADQRFTSRGKDTMSRVEGMLNDAARLLDSPQTTDVVYYLRWTGDDETLDPRSATGKGQTRRVSQVNIHTPGAINGRVRNGSFNDGRSSSISAQPQDVAGSMWRYDEALSACRSQTDGASTTNYYGTQYKKDQVLAPPSDPASGLHVPSVVTLHTGAALDEAGIAVKSGSELELRDPTTASTTYYTTDEVVEMTAGPDAVLASGYLERSISCAVDGLAAAVVITDTAPLTSAEATRWRVVRQLCVALLSTLERVAAGPFLLSARAVLLPESTPNTMIDLLGQTPDMEALKYSPVCGPTAKDATTVVVKGGGDVDDIVQLILSALASRAGTGATRAEVRGAVAIQMAVHQFLFTSSALPDTGGAEGASESDDVRLSCLWCVCSDSHGDWLSTAMAQPKSCTAKLLDFWLGGPCFSTAVVAVSVSSADKTDGDVSLRRRFDRLIKVQDSFRAVTLGTPRDGRVSQFEAYLNRLAAKTEGDSPSPRLKAMLTEAAQLRRKAYARCVSTGKAPSLLAHETKMFTMMDS